MPTQDFTIRFEPTPSRGRYRIIATSPADGAAQADFVSPFGQERIKNWASGLDPSETRLIGNLLFTRLFPSPILAAFNATRREAERQGLVLRLILKLDPLLDSLPWEYLCDPLTNEFLLLEQHIPLVRYPAGTLDVGNHSAAAVPFSILRLLSLHSAKPQSLYQPDRTLPFSDIDFATLRGIPDAVLPTAPILHIYADSDYDPPSGQLALFPAGADHAYSGISLEMLELWLKRNRAIRLIVLNPLMESGPGVQTAVTTASELVRRNLVSMAVTLQFPMTADALETFLNAFYSALQAGLSVDTALLEGRVEVAFDYDPNDWGAPILISGSGDTGLIHSGSAGLPARQDAPAAIPLLEARGAGGTLTSNAARE